MLEPAKTVTEICGGVSEIARLAECSLTRAQRFGYPKDRGGTGGHIPADRQVTLIRNARAEGIALEPKHFFPADVLAITTPASFAGTNAATTPSTTPAGESV